MVQRGARLSYPPIRPMEDYNRRARAYWVLCVVLGVCCIVYSFYAVGQLPARSQFQIAFGVGLAALCGGVFPQRIGSSKLGIAGAEVFVFLLLLMHGPSAATLASAAEGATGALRSSTRWTNRIATPAMGAIAMSVSGGLFAFLRLAFADAGSSLSFAATLTLMAFVASTYFAAGILLPSALLALVSGARIRPLKTLSELGWLCGLYIAYAAMVVVIVVNYAQFGSSVFLAAIPVFAMLVLTQRMALERIDVAERNAAESARHLAELRQSESRFHKSFTYAPIGMALITNERIVIQANPALGDLLHLPVETIVGADFGGFLSPGECERLDKGMRELADDGAVTISMELRCVRPDGEILVASIHAAQFPASDVPAVILQVVDITVLAILTAGSRGASGGLPSLRDAASAVAAAEALHYRAIHDDLTGLYNRAYFERVLDECLRQSEGRRLGIAVLFIDLDGFKSVNDTLGHQKGDEVLRLTASALQNNVRATDIVARHSGDEFVVLLRDLLADHEAVAVAGEIGVRLREELRQFRAVAGLNASIGHAAYFGASPPPLAGELIRRADEAMYEDKRMRKGQRVER